jgi:hypothetical protein
MADVRNKEQPEWLAALRDPTLGELWLSPFVAPEHLPDVLKAFGEQETSSRRRIVIALDEMATKLWFARKHKAPKKFSAAKRELKPLEDAADNLLALWLEASPYYAALLKATILMIPPKERRNHAFAFNSLDPGPALAKLLPAIRALRTQEIYTRAFSQPPRSQKSLERALLWEPLFDLMHDFKIEEFDRHQPMIHTARALHLACSLRPPDEGKFRVTLNDWRKRQQQALS